VTQGFNVKKAAQVVAYFAWQSGGSINVLKLAKLVYLADREFMAVYDAPILNDKIVSMDHGPVNSITLNYVNGLASSPDWSTYINGRAQYEVGLTNKISVADLDELSEAEVDILEVVWKRFGNLDKYAVRDYTHRNCPEWEDPNGSSNPIPYERIFKFLGKQDTRYLAEKVSSDRHVDFLLHKERLAATK